MDSQIIINNYFPVKKFTFDNLTTKTALDNSTTAIVKSVSGKRTISEVSDLVSEATTNDTASSFHREFVRSGKWSMEEESYANELIKRFQAGTLADCSPGCSLRTYLSNKLQCAPMRISKKFAGLCIGKESYKSIQEEVSNEADNDLKKLENLYSLSSAATQGNFFYRRSISPDNNNNNSLDESNQSSEESSPILKRDNSDFSISSSFVSIANHIDIPIQSEWLLTGEGLNSIFDVNNNNNSKEEKSSELETNDILNFFYGDNGENCDINSYKEEYQLVIKDSKSIKK